MTLPPQLFRAFENFRDQAKDAIWALSSCLCQQTPAVKINGRTFQIIKVLGEGGFSFVYLAQDEHSGVRSDAVFDEVGMLRFSIFVA
jgi:serine/threonine kinase 16